MCGRFTQTTDPAEVAEAFEADLAGSARALPPRWNVAPTQDVTVVLAHEDRRRVEALRWGLVPAWAPSPAIGSRLINARAETATTTPAFRVAIRRRRCLIPADGFYEWRRDGRRRQPFLAQPHHGGPIAFAGLWSLWRDADSDQWLRSCAIVTTGPNAVLAELHDRMPVVLEPREWARWLDPDVAPGEVRAMLQPARDDLLRLVPVSPLVNDVRNEGPRLIEPVALETGDIAPEALTLPLG